MGLDTAHPLCPFFFVLLALVAFSCIYWMALCFREMFHEFYLRFILDIVFISWICDSPVY